MKKTLLATLLILFGCGEPTQTKTEIPVTDNPNNYIEGEAYHLKGKDSTVCSGPFYTIKFNKLTEVYDTTRYKICNHREWSLEYTNGAILPIWYWHEKSKTWYTFKRNGRYYKFKWVETTKYIKN
jgi:hypothetical protein